MNRFERLILREIGREEFVLLKFVIDVGGKRVVIEIAAGDVFVFRELGVKFGDAAVEIGALNFRLVRGVLLKFVEIRIAFDGQVVAERVAVFVDRLADDGRDVSSVASGAKSATESVPPTSSESSDLSFSLMRLMSSRRSDVRYEF